MARTVVIILMFILYKLSVTASSRPLLTAEGNITWLDGAFYVPIGQPIQLLCHVALSKNNVSLPVLAFRNDVINKVVHIDNDTIHAVISHNVTGSYVYMCCLNTCPTLIEISLHYNLLDSLTFKYGHVPTIANIECMAYNIHYTMECSFTATTHCYQYHTRIQHALTRATNKTWECSGDNFTYSYTDGQARTCVCGNLAISGRELYNVTIVGHNNYGNITDTTQVFTGPNIMKYQLEGLHIEAVYATYLTVTYTVVLYQEEVADALPHAKVIVKTDTNSTSFVTNKTKISINRLHPATNYSITIDIKPLNSPFWSEPVEANVITKEAVPDRPPGVYPGLFSWSDSSTITLYWTLIPLASRNGIIRNYRVCWITYFITLCNSTVPNDQFFFDLKHVTKLDQVEITLQAKTHIGWSNMSYITLFPWQQEDASIAYVIVEYIDQSNYEVSWILSNQTSLHDHVSIVWCHGNRYNGRIGCRTGLNVTPLNAHDEKLTVNIGTGIPANLWFGAFTSSKGVSSRITWNTCIFQKHGGFIGPTPFQVVPHHDSATVFLHFGYCSVSKESGRPQTYDIAVEEVSTSSCFGIKCTDDNVVSQPASYDTTELKLISLNESEYCVCLRVSTNSSRGEFSDPVLVNVTDVYLEKISHVIADTQLVIGVTVSLGLLCLLIFSCILYNTKRLCSQMNKKVSITMDMFESTLRIQSSSLNNEGANDVIGVCYDTCRRHENSIEDGSKCSEQRPDTTTSESVTPLNNHVLSPYAVKSLSTKDEVQVESQKSGQIMREVPSYNVNGLAYTIDLEVNESGLSSPNDGYSMLAELRSLADHSEYIQHSTEAIFGKYVPIELDVKYLCRPTILSKTPTTGIPLIQLNSDNRQLSSKPISPASNTQTTGLYLELNSDYIQHAVTPVSGTLNTGLSLEMHSDYIQHAVTPVSGTLNTGLSLELHSDYIQHCSTLTMPSFNASHASTRHIDYTNIYITSQRSSTPTKPIRDKLTTGILFELPSDYLQNFSSTPVPDAL